MHNLLLQGVSASIQRLITSEKPEVLTIENHHISGLYDHDIYTLPAMGTVNYTGFVFWIISYITVWIVFSFYIVLKSLQLTYYVSDSLFRYVRKYVDSLKQPNGLPPAYKQTLEAFLWGAGITSFYIITLCTAFFLFTFLIYHLGHPSFWAFSMITNKMMHILNGNLFIINWSAFKVMAKQYNERSVHELRQFLIFSGFEVRVNDGITTHDILALSAEQDRPTLFHLLCNFLVRAHYEGILPTNTTQRLIEELKFHVKDGSPVRPDPKMQSPPKEDIWFPTVPLSKFNRPQSNVSFETVDLEMDSISPEMRLPGIPFDFKLTADTDLNATIRDAVESLDSGINLNHTLSSPDLISLSNSLERVVQQLTNKGVKTDISLNTEGATDILALVALLGTSFNCYLRPTKTNTIYLGCAAVYAISKFGPTYLPLDLLKRDYVTKPQISNGELTEIVTSIALLICSYSAINKPSEFLIKNIITELTNFKKYSSSLDTLLKFAVNAIEKIINLFRRYVLGERSIIILETGRAHLDDILARIRNVDDKIHQNTFHFTLENSDLVHTLYQDANALLLSLPKDRESQNFVSALSAGITYIYKLKQKMDAMSLNFDGIRQEPCALLMRGPPGCGKSQAMEHLCYRMLSTLLPPDRHEQARRTPKDFIHNRQAENVYWEGMDHEKVITLLDDVGQARDVQGNPDNEIMNVIRAINIFEYNCHMAELGKKGNIKFVSKMVIANTNMISMEFNSIIQPEAFFRRFDVIADVCPKREYCTEETRDLSVWKRVLDKTKLPIGSEGITSMHPKILEFHCFDYKSKQLTGEVFDFDQLVTTMKYFADLKKTRFVQYQKELEDSKVVPQVDWSIMFPVSSKYRFNNPDLDDQVHKFIDIYIKNPDYLNSSSILCAHYRRSTGYDHKLEYIIAVYLKIFPQFLDAHSWDTVTMANFAIAEEHQLIKVPIIGIKHRPEIVGNIIKTFTEFTKKFEEYFLIYAPKLTKIENYLAMAAPILLTASAYYALWKAMTKSVEPDAANGAESGKNNKQKNTVTYKQQPSMRHAQALKAGSIIPQSSSQLAYDKSNVEILNKVVARNVYEIILNSDDGSAGFATFIRGNVFVINRHFVTLVMAKIEEDASILGRKFRLRKPSTEVYFDLPISLLLDFKVPEQLEYQDVAFIEAPKYVPQHLDIIKYFVSRNNIEKFKDLTYRLILPSHDNYRSWMGQAIAQDTIEVTHEVVCYNIRLGYRYLAMTQAGDCGALMTLCSNHSGAKKILGIHAAGNTNGYAYSTALFQEDLDEVMKMFQQQIICDIEEDSAPQSKLNFYGPQFAPRYQTDLKMNTSGKTSKKRSPLYGLVAPVTTGPARLRPFIKDGVTIDPMQLSISKYCKNHTVIDESLVEAIGDQLYDDIKRQSPFSFVSRIFTFEEAILGLEDDPLFGSISRSTSPGYPYNCTHPGPGKTYWFGTAQEYDLNNERVEKLRERCEDIVNKAKQGIRMIHIYGDCPKDEITTLKKVAIGKTRAFSCSPQDLVIVFRRYFGSFVRFIAENKIENNSAIGVNPYSIDWDLIVKHLQAKGSGSNLGAGDYKAFDGSEIPQIHYEILRIINRFYDDGNDLIRFVLWQEIVNSVHIKENMIYEWPSSLPSGNPLTTIVNNFYNLFCFRFCWLVAHDYDLACLPLFTKHVYVIVMGDDNLFSVSHEKIATFNLRSIERDMLLLGMTYTSDDKESEIGDMLPLDKVTFLKRSFRYSEILCRYVAPLNLTTIVEMLNWTTSGPQERIIVDDNIQTAFQELSLYSRPVYDAFTKKILGAIDRARLSWPSTTSYVVNHMFVAGMKSKY